MDYVQKQVNYFSMAPRNISEFKLKHGHYNFSGLIFW